MPPSYTNEYEVHIVTFERYCDLPEELEQKKRVLLKQAESDPRKKQDLRDEELVNPWLITDLDFSGNPHVK